MFQTLTRFTGALPNLTNANMSFWYSKLTSWDVELPSLTRARSMFESAVSLRAWTIDMPRLDFGEWMFGACYTITSFEGDLGKLTNGNYMLGGCRSLVSFSSALLSLTNGNRMFEGCKLNRESVQTISRTIKDNSSMATPPTLTLGMAKGLKGQVDTELDLIRQKGWNLTPQYN